MLLSLHLSLRNSDARRSTQQWEICRYLEHSVQSLLINRRNIGKRQQGGEERF